MKPFLFLALILCLEGLYHLTVKLEAGSEQGSGHTSALTEYQPKIVITDADRSVDTENAVVVNLDEMEGECLITEPGTYLLTGSLKGQVRVDAQDQIVHLILSQAEIDSSDGPALAVSSAGKVIVTLAEGTSNILLDSAYYSSGEDACIYSECDLTINGSGTLTVSGYYKDAIHAKDVLKLLGGNIIVQSKRDGIHGNDGIVIDCEYLSAQSERNGLNSTKTGKEGKGNIEIYVGTVSVIAGEYGISCAADLYMAGGSMDVSGIFSDFSVGGNTYTAEGSQSSE